MEDASVALSGGTASYLVARPVVDTGDTGSQQNCELFVFIVSFVLVGLTCAVASPATTCRW